MRIEAAEEPSSLDRMEGSQCRGECCVEIVEAMLAKLRDLDPGKCPKGPAGIGNENPRIFGGGKSPQPTQQPCSVRLQPKRSPLRMQAIVVHGVPLQATGGAPGAAPEIRTAPRRPPVIVGFPKDVWFWTCQLLGRHDHVVGGLAEGGIDALERLVEAAMG